MSLNSNFGDRFSDSFRILAQAMLPKVEFGVLVDTNDGENRYEDHVGEMDGQVIAEGNWRDQTPIQADNTQRTQCTIANWEWSRLITRPDVVRVMKTPVGQYVRSAVASRNRYCNKLIMDEAIADANRGRSGGTAVALPAEQKVDEGGTEKLTIAKLREAHQKLADAGALDMDDAMLYYCGTHKQKDDLLATTEATSADYNTVKALVEGRIDTFMGFKFIWVTSNEMTANTNVRENVAWARPGIMFRKPVDLFQRVQEWQTYRFNTHVYLNGEFGAARLDDKLVVQVRCLES